MAKTPATEPVEEDLTATANDAPAPAALLLQGDLGPVLAQLMAQVSDLQAKLASADDAKQKAIDTEVERAKEAFKAVPYYRAVPPVVPQGPAPDGWCKARVLPDGDGRVSTGDYDQEQRAFTYYKYGDVFMLPQAVYDAMGTDPDGKRVSRLVESIA